MCAVLLCVLVSYVFRFIMCTVSMCTGLLCVLFFHGHLKSLVAVEMEIKGYSYASNPTLGVRFAWSKG